MKTKTFDVEIKAAGDDGIITAYAAVFGNVDSYGDVVVKGAFEESLADYATSGDPVAVYWRHRMDDPLLNIGGCTGEEDDHGLLVRIMLDLENPKAAYTLKLVKERRVRKMSFAYDVVEAGWVETTENGQTHRYYELRKLLLHEVSIVPVGANQETEILTAKSAIDAVVAGVHAGRTLTADELDEAKAAREALSSVIPTEDQGQADDPSDAKAEEPEGAKAEEPTTGPSAQHLGLIHITTAL